MYCTRNVTDSIVWVGGNDRRLALFENAYPIPRGVSYNSYVLLDEKTVMFDTADKAVSEQFFENVEYVLNGRPLDYLIVNHMEPDHCANIAEVVLRYPDVKLVGNAKTVTMIKQFFNIEVDSRTEVVKEGDTLNTGKHTLTFLMAPMVHWPEAMVTYDVTDKTLFSADAFGTFGALNGNLFADEVNFERDWLDDARRYFVNIVGKYGPQVQALLKKASTVEIQTICPLHGPVWRENLGWFIDKYKTWASYEAEEEGVVIVYSSIYGNTEQAVNYLALRLSDLGVRNIHMYDSSKTDCSYLLSECFRYPKAVFASVTYNLELFPKMESLLLDLKAHLYQKRKVAIVECGTWALQSGKKMTDRVYTRYTGYPGGQRFTTPKEILAKRPAELVRRAVKGMLPKTRLGDDLLGNLYVYAGPEHPHQAQNPKVIKLDEI